MGSSSWTLPKLRILNNLFSAQGLASSGGSAPSLFAYNWLWKGMTFSDKDEGNVTGAGTRMWDDEDLPDFVLPDTPLGESARSGALDVSQDFTVDGKSFPALPGCSAYQPQFGATVTEDSGGGEAGMTVDKQVVTAIRDIPSGDYTVRVQLVQGTTVVSENVSDAFTVPPDGTPPPFVEVPVVTDLAAESDEA
jgi:hypothetical protein